MKILILSAVMAASLLGVSAPVNAGNCDHSWQTAADGSSCGNRAADRREGGR